MVSIAQIKEFLKVAKNIEFKGKLKKEKYAWVEDVLIRFRYFSLRKKDKSVIKGYLTGITGYSDAQLTRLISKKKKVGKIIADSTSRHKFSRIYGPGDISLLINTDKLHERLSGKAVKRIFEREYGNFGKSEYATLKNISVSHIYNLRETRQYLSFAKFFVKTKPTPVTIGERRKPDPEGMPGYLRIDTVHQGDSDKEKGVYHINVVDEITQWEIVGCVEKISEHYLIPLLEDILKQFPFGIKGFHSDNGSEFINKVVARLLNKLLIEQTKSRPRHSGDNGLVETKNGAVIRKHMGYIHIPQRYAQDINMFYKEYLNVYLNYHRPCGYPTEIVSDKGKIKKIYEIYMTPYEKLRSLDNAERHLKDRITFEDLSKTANEKSDNEFAALMQKEKENLFNKFKQPKLQLPMTYVSFISGSYVD
jgi:hypothetical protein